nr:serine/threonine-protein kinase [Nannocystis pusilla]
MTRTARADWQPAEADPPLQTGAVIDGRYRVITVIGEGGMGRVYETEHLFLRRRLALKLVRRDAGTGEAAKRLLQEAVLAGKVPHATVVPVFDCAALPDGQVYVAMELLRGESLEEALLRPQRAEEVLRWLAEVARGLAAAHRAGIVHRDVKPANLFLARAGDGTVQPRILDFGIAKLLPGLAGEAGAVVQTQAGALLGTPFYMAPERIRGETGDGSADLYGFGVILYEALTGQVPFLGEGFMEIVGRHLREPPLDPRQAAPQRRIPDALAELALALLRKEPQARPHDGDAVAAALLAVLEREPATVASLRLGAEAPTSVSAEATTQAIEEGSTQRLEGHVIVDMSGKTAVIEAGDPGDMSGRTGPAAVSVTAPTLAPGLEGANGAAASRSEMSVRTGSAEMSAGTGSGSRARSLSSGTGGLEPTPEGGASLVGRASGQEPARTDMSSGAGRSASLRAAALVLACAAGGLVAWVLMPREEAGEAGPPIVEPAAVSREVGAGLPVASPADPGAAAVGTTQANDAERVDPPAATAASETSGPAADDGPGRRPRRALRPNPRPRRPCRRSRRRRSGARNRRAKLVQPSRVRRGQGRRSRPMSTTSETPGCQRPRAAGWRRALVGALVFALARPAAAAPGAPPEAPATVDAALAAGDLGTARALAEKAREADPSAENWRREAEVCQRLADYACARAAWKGTWRPCRRGPSARRARLGWLPSRTCPAGQSPTRRHRPTARRSTRPAPTRTRPCAPSPRSPRGRSRPRPSASGS